MEIIQVAGCYPPHLGGEELVAQHLATGQTPHHRVTVYTSTTGAETAPRHERDGALTVHRDNATQIGATPIIWNLTRRLLTHTPKPDLIHIHAGLAALPEMVQLATTIRRIPYIAHIHLLVRPSSTPGKLLLPLYHHTLYRMFLHRAAHIICLTPTMRDTLIHTYRLPPHNITVVPNGVDTTVFTPAPFHQRSTTDLLIAGRITAQKNTLTAVDAMTHLPHLTLHIAGDGDQTEQVKNRITQLRLTNVVLHGRLPTHQLAHLYRTTALVLMPSTHEGHPLVLLEALATGAPVITTTTPELLHAGADATAHTPTPTTPETLATTIHDLINNPTRRQTMSQKAIAHAATHTWPTTLTTIDTIYDHVTNR